MKSSVVKRSVVIDGHKSSVSLEDSFWTELKKIAHAVGSDRQDRGYARTEQSILGDPPVCSSALPWRQANGRSETASFRDGC